MASLPTGPDTPFKQQNKPRVQFMKENRVRISTLCIKRPKTPKKAPKSVLYLFKDYFIS
jgi:hypothetical protein